MLWWILCSLINIWTILAHNTAVERYFYSLQNWINRFYSVLCLRIDKNNFTSHLSAFFLKFKNFCIIRSDTISPTSSLWPPNGPKWSNKVWSPFLCSFLLFPLLFVWGLLCSSDFKLFGFSVQFWIFLQFSVKICSHNVLIF